MLGHEHEEEREYSEGGYLQDWRRGWRRISWGAIFAGAFVTLAVFLTLQILGAGIGLSAVDLTGREVTSARSLGIGAAIWWLLTGLIALFIGGWVAGRLGWLANKLDRVLHGLTVWAVFYAIMFVLATTALGALAGGGLAALGGTASAAGQAAASSPEGQGQGLSLDVIQQEVARMMGADAAAQDPQASSKLVSAVSDYYRGSKTPQERQQLVQTIMQTTGKSEAEANRMIDNLDRKVQQAKETGEQAANITGASLIGMAISMLLGAVAAMLGSLLAPAPRFVPPYERGREAGARAEERTYVSR